MEKEMIEQQIERLMQEIQKLGFPDEVKSLIRQKFTPEDNFFYIPYDTVMDSRSIKGTVSFAKDQFTDQSYYVYGFTMNLPKDGTNALDDNVFVLGTGYDVNLREAYNMMQGRSVFRPGRSEEEGQWLGFDLGTSVMGSTLPYYRNSPFRADAAVAASPLAKWMTAVQREALIASLNSGNVQEVALNRSGHSEKLWVEADPALRALHIRDAAGERVNIRQRELVHERKLETVAEHNMRLLEEKLRRSGFGEDMISAMREKVMQQKDHAFYIPYSARTEEREFSGYVYADRYPENGHYRLGNFSIDLGKESGRPLRENTFYFTDGHAVTLREGFNLMQGRAVYREPLFDNDRRGYWVTLNDQSVVRGAAALNYERVTRYVEEVVAGSPVGKLLTPERVTALAEALKKGDHAALTVETKGLTKLVWVEMDPVMESLRLTDGKGKLMGLPEPRQERRLEASIERRRGRKR